MSAIPEKWRTRSFDFERDEPMILKVTTKEISPAWADYMEAFAKEMAEAVVNFVHVPGHPAVPRAQEYLKGKP